MNKAIDELYNRIEKDLTHKVNHELIVGDRPFYEERINFANSKIRFIKQNLKWYNPFHWFLFLQRDYFIQQWTLIIEDYQKCLQRQNLKNSFVKGLQHSIDNFRDELIFHRRELRDLTNPNNKESDE